MDVPINLYVPGMYVPVVGAHSDAARELVPQSCGQPSEESTSHRFELIVVVHMWSRIPSPSQSIFV